MKKRVAIIGASGFTGLTLLRIASRHPHVEIVALDSPSFAGKPVRALYPHYRGKAVFTGHTIKQIADLAPDLVFTAMPNGQAMKIVPRLPASTKAVDLAADYRFKDLRVFEKVYGMKHADRRRGAVYGLPEIHRGEIAAARVVGNPGCYVTASILSALPLARAGLIDKVVFDGKSGYSGAGRSASEGGKVETFRDNVTAYKLDFHRHRPEIDQILGLKCSFSPQVVGLFRGILVTAHVYPAKTLSRSRLVAMYRRFYAGAPFVDVWDGGVPSLHDVQGTNLCLIGGFERDHTGRVVIVSVIDNLVKGASGQAMQNANLMLGLPETEGLTGVITPKTKV